ncbi:MAG TPA: gamma-glutamyltransferase [Candidatus Aminicenantes bacterium]|nr:gamma-glutamyltransferase [Candidatus Aminicenantes bacterium]HRY66039.1 gamma-glutamyltransferase [Candidatus Aminicenantes bacterium]HRZ72912.1 gamma-glutamyltransferase [Candidatus Aminicenantes bacterium]
MIAGRSLARRAAGPAAVLLLGLSAACAGGRPVGPGDVVARRAMAASAHPAATAVGLEILKKGGNAVDAAVATAFALGLAEPNASGVGGGGFMIVKMAGRPEAVMIDYRETAPRGATPEYYYGAGPSFDARTAEGPDSVGVPGLVAGAALALEKFGTMSLAQVLEPAIRLCREGVTVSPKLNGMIVENMEKLQKYPAAAAIYLPDGLPAEPGAVLRNEDLAATLERLAAGGPRVFYEGPMAEAVVAELRRLGGVMEAADLAGYQAKLRTPVAGTYRGYEILSAAPPTGGGTHLVELLNIIEGFDVKSMGPASARLIHVLAEAMKMIYADKAVNSGDPDVFAIPVAALTDKAYAAGLRDRIVEGKARFDYAPPSLVGRERESTSHLSVADEKGNVVALTQSINSFFGSGIVVPGTGVILNNHLADFDSQPGGPNAIGPGRRPASSIAPTVVCRSGKPVLVLGSPGATRIVSALAQIVINFVDFGMGLDEAIEAPRVHCLTKTLAVEGRIPGEVVKTLESWGHKVKVYPDWDNYFGGAQGIFLDARARRICGAADSRRDGAAAGY